CGTKPSSARKSSPMSLYSVNQSHLRVLCWYQMSAACESSFRPSHSSARSGRLGVSVLEKRSCPVTVSLLPARHWKSGPYTRLYPLPSTSRSVARKLTNDLPKSRRSRAIPTKEEKSWCAKLEPFGPGMMTLPPPRSTAMNPVYWYASILPVARRPQRGEVMLRVYTAWIGVEKSSSPSRKKGRFSG